MIERIRALAKEIETSISGADVEFTVFPSGSAMLDVRRGGRLFVLSYSPSRHFGVDEVHDGEGFQLGYRFAGESFEQAAEHLKELVSGCAIAKAAAAAHSIEGK